MRRLATLAALGAALLAAPSALAASGEGGFVFTEHGFYIIDFLVFFGIIFYYARGPARRFLEERHASATREMAEATRVRAEAEERLARYEQLLAALDGEIDRMREQFREEGERERARILDEADAEAQRIRHDTQMDLTREGAQLKLDLEREVAERAVARAEAIVRARMTANVQKGLVNSFIKELEGRHDLGSLSA